jgi:hypothetical protein
VFPLVSTEAVPDLVAMPDPELHALVESCARARAALDALEARALSEVDRRALARRSGAVDTAAWLADTTGVSPGAARSRLRLAGTVDALPAAAEALAEGAVSADHLAALNRAIAEVGAEVVADAQEELVGWARGSSAHRFGRRLRRWVLRQHARQGTAADDIARAHRSLRIGGDPVTGLGSVVASLPVDDHAIVANGLWSLVEEQWRSEKSDPAATMPRDEPTIPQRLADALVEMARRAAGATLADRSLARPLLAVVIDADSLMGRLDVEGLGRLADGTPVPVELARRRACEADLYPVVLGGKGAPLDIGRARRLATPAQRVAMLARSQTCEWPGCSTPASWCEAHHLDPWRAGGRTAIDNLAWMCNGHHHLAHEGGWSVWRSPEGGLVVSAPGAASPRSPAPPGDPPPEQRADPPPGRTRTTVASPYRSRAA